MRATLYFVLAIKKMPKDDEKNIDKSMCKINSGR